MTAGAALASAKRKLATKLLETHKVRATLELAKLSTLASTLSALRIDAPGKAVIFILVFLGLGGALGRGVLGSHDSCRVY